jgi:hypothetical protein
VLSTFAHEAADAAGIRRSPRPLFRGEGFWQTSGASRREIAKLYLGVIARSEATKQSISVCRAMDCFAEPVIGRRFAPTRWLAMTMSGCLKIESVAMYCSRICHALSRRHPPPGLGFGEPDDRLQRVIQYSRDASDRTEKPRRTGYPACAGYDDYL